MAEFSGSALYAQWIWSGGTVQLNSDYRQFQDAPTIDLLEATAGSDPAKTYITDRKDGNVTVNMLHQTGGTAMIAALAEGVCGTLIWGEEGTATNKPKTTMPAISMGAQRNVQYNALVEISVTFQQNGARTYDKY